MLASSPIYLLASVQWPGRRCPCCTRQMSNKVPRRGQRNPSNMMTMGHDVPVSRGGRDVWLYICCRCNQDQKDRTFLEWAHTLVHHNDPRAENVIAVARFLKEVIECKVSQRSSWVPASSAASAPSP